MSEVIPEKEATLPAPPLALALAPLVFLLAVMGWAIVGLGADAHIPLLLSAIFAGVCGRFAGRSWKVLEEGMLKGLQVGLQAILILLVIGVLIALWIAAGIVPLFIDYGLALLSGAVFLPAAATICAVVSLATGSSWTTAGTVGVALMGVGGGLGFPLPMVAGAVVSGAYFGDKMSPLSDSTNLAAAVCGVDLFAHIRHMIYTTGPSFGLALIAFALLGLSHAGADTGASSIAEIQDTLRTHFNLSPVLLLAPLAVIVLSMRRAPALPSLIAAALLGALLAWFVQGVAPAELLSLAYGGFSPETGNPEVDSLLARGGFESMLYAVSLILCALSFGGLMEVAGFIQRLAELILRPVRGRGGLVTATVGTCLGMNITASDQYLAIIIPGRMYASAYRERRLAAINLSRTLEDAGTVTSPLVPWNTCGATMTLSLGVAPMAFLPFAFFNLLAPLVAIAWAFLGWAQRPLEDKEQ